MGKTYYMIGNAHLDPVWQWQWMEGYAETKATFRSALDRMNEYDDFMFVCSSASIYEWCEECAPAMFEEIKKRIAEGRWVIVGGWWVQPDCNLPSGESFARQSLYSQRYFYEKFGVISKVGYDVDSFGHNHMIPQILKKSGMDYYVFMRPGEHEKHMDTNIFTWISPDGSKVLAYRLRDPYCNNIGSVEDLQRTMKAYNDYGYSDIDELMLFYGVGNHGGGPTIRNINVIKEMQEKNPDDEFIFSNPYDYFKKIEEKGYKLAEHNDDLQHHASGCYAASSLINRLNRKCETKLIAAEKYSTLANLIAAKSYPMDSFRTAWKNTMFNQFHDSLGGCSMQYVYDDASNMAGEALSIAQKSENAALQTLSWQIDTMGRNEYPIVVFNPHSWDIRSDIVINKQCKSILDNDGNPIPSQLVISPTEACTHRKDTLFKADIPAFGYNVYYMSGEENEFENSLEITENMIENQYLRVKFEKHTGYISEMYDKANDCQLLNGYGAVPVVIDEYEHDTWSHARNFFTKQIAQFSDAEYSIIDKGPVKVTLKVTSKYNGSTLSQYFSLDSESKTLSVRSVIDWHEKHKMLKIAYPVNTANPKALYEIPFGFIERPCDGEEECGQQWIMVRGSDRSMAMLNDSKYSFSIADSTMYMSVVRSPLFADHGGPRNPETPFMDQGSHEFNYAVIPYCADVEYSTVVKAAQEFNTKPTNIIENRHEGRLDTKYQGISVDKANIIISAFKLAEDGKGYVVRAYETNGIETDVTISIPSLKHTFTTRLGKHEVQTLYIANENVREVLLTEMSI